MSRDTSMLYDDIHEIMMRVWAHKANATQATEELLSKLSSGPVGWWRLVPIEPDSAMLTAVAAYDEQCAAEGRKPVFNEAWYHALNMAPSITDFPPDTQWR